MSNMNVKQRLVISFLVIAVITSLVGGVGITGLFSLDKSQDQMYVYAVNIDYVNSLIENIQKQRIAYRDVILYSEDAARCGEAIIQLTQLDTEYNELFTYLHNSLATEKSQALLTEISQAYNVHYEPLREQLIEAAQAGNHEKIDQVMGALAPQIDTIVDSATTLIEYALQFTGNVSKQDSRTASIMIIVLTTLAVAAVVGAITLGLYIARHITVPLLKMKNVMDQVGNTGNLTFTAEEMDALKEEARGKDEICQSIASSLKMISHFESASGVLQRVADGDLTDTFHNLSSRDTIGVALNQMLDNLNAMFNDIHLSSVQVSSGAGQVSQGAQELASGSSQQAASIEEFSATLLELRDKTDHNAENATKAREANTKTAERLNGSIQSMGEMLKAMQAIDESSGDITKVIKVIDDIAFQTNILALNAAVEAARAGQHGKGFAVVADEVRNLAAKSAEAAKETAGLIEGSSERVKEGNQIVARTNADLEAAAENAQEITHLIEMVATESSDQATAIAEINQGIEQISSVVQANSATSEQSAAASEQMSAQAEALEAIVAKFKLRSAGYQKVVDTGYAEASIQPVGSAIKPRASGFALSFGRARTSA